MDTVKLYEQGTLVADKSADGTFPITIISEGVGSTGVYSREMLRENVDAFTKGTKSFIDHPKDPSKPWERSLTMIAGKLAEDAHYDESDGEAKLRSKLKVDKRWESFVEEYKDVIGLSVYIDAFGEKNSDGKVVVEGFVKDDPYKSVDLVVAAGRGGRFDTAMEAYRTIENSLGDPTEDGSGNPAKPHNPSKEDSNMELEELAGKVDKLTESLSAFVDAATPILESLKPREDDGELDYVAFDDAVVEAKLPKVSRKVVLEAVRNGAVIEDAIKEQMDLVESVREDLKVQEGFVSGENSFSGSATDLGKVLG